MLLDVRPRNRKPAFGSVEIDWSHPLARQLTFYTVLNEGGGFPTNLVRIPASATLAQGSWVPGPRGQTFQTASANDRIRFAASTKYSLATDGAFSVSWQFMRTGQAGSGADGYVAGRTSFGSAGLWEVYDDNTNLNFGHNGATGINLGAKPTNNVVHAVTVTRVPGGTYTCYIDGAQNGQTINANATGADGAQTLVIGAIGEDATNLNIYAKWDWVLIHKDRTLTRSEHQQLVVEPYAFLKPKLATFFSWPYKTSGAAPPPTGIFRRTLSQHGTRIGSRQAV